jgi:hypothetical protein
MLGQLGDEYTNQGALIGLGATANEIPAEVAAELRKMNPIQRQRTMNKLTAPPPASKGSRAEMEKHFAELPEHIRDGLKKGELLIV